MVNADACWSSPDRPTARAVPATNTLVLVIPRADSSSALLQALHPHFASAAPLLLWAPLKGLGRVVVVFETQQGARLAKCACTPAARPAHTSALFDRTLVEQHDTGTTTTLRVYNGPDTSPDLLAKSTAPRLEVPPLDKNFLISPPSSPPVGWQQIREDRPNADTLAADLIRALSGLTTDDDADEMDAGGEEETPRSPSGGVRLDTDTTLIQAADDQSTPGVRLLVPTDAVEPSSSTTLLNTPRGMPRTIAGVRATAEAIRGTARPPLAP